MHSLSDEEKIGIVRFLIFTLSVIFQSYKIAQKKIYFFMPNALNFNEMFLLT